MITNKRHPESGPRSLPFHYEASAVVAAPAHVVFDYVDDHEHLSSHMSQSSWMMGKGRMLTEFDAGRGRQVGSLIRLTGRVLGIRLSVAEKVTERDPPRSKAWETTDQPRLLVVGHYRMGFEITPRGRESQLRIFIDYALPDSARVRWFARLFGDFYARWCTHQMVDGVAAHFNQTSAPIQAELKAHREN